MNSDLYNFHNSLPQQQQFQPPTTSSSPSRSIASSSVFCRSWNNCPYAWPYGQCRYHHCCEKCEGEHPCVNCPFEPRCQVKVDYVISGLVNGFHLGFDPLAVSSQSAVYNVPSASLQPSVIDQYLLSELEKDLVAGLFLISPIPNPHVNYFGVIPKKHQPGKWWLI